MSLDCDDCDSNRVMRLFVALLLFLEKLMQCLYVFHVIDRYQSADQMS